MHAELVVPGLLPRPDAPPFSRTPALELLLARGRSTRGERSDYEQWLAAACGSGEDAPLAAGALTLLAEGGEPGDAVWMRADPVHLRLGRAGLSFVPAGAFELDASESAALAEALNLHYQGELEFRPVSSTAWCVRLAAPPRLVALPTAGVAGRDVDTNLPTGEDATLWHARLNEIQMLLHAHPVNDARDALGLPTVNSTWFWGAGRIPVARDLRWQSVSADEPVARGLALHCRRRAMHLPESAQAWLARLPEDGRHLAVLDALRMPLSLGDNAAWNEHLAGLEANWFAPLLEALRSGRIGMLTVHAPGDHPAFAIEAVRSDLRKFWRRRQPLSAYA